MGSSSELDDVLRLRAFLALGDRKLDLLAFRQGLEAVADDCTEVHKHVGAAFLLDKTESLRFIKPR